jgi:hypothetical protein
VKGKVSGVLAISANSNPTFYHPVVVLIVPRSSHPMSSAQYSFVPYGIIHMLHRVVGLFD